MKKPLPIVTVAEEFCAENLKLKRVNAELLEACKGVIEYNKKCSDKSFAEKIFMLSIVNEKCEQAIAKAEEE